MLKFLKKQAKTTQEKLANIAVGFLLAFISNILVLKLYSYIFAVESFYPFGQFQRLQHPFLAELFLACILAPIWEEIVFRHVPLKFVKALKKENELLIPVILGTSCIFGLLHYGPPSLLLQGVGGFIFACVYIKNGYSLWSAILIHAMWNLFILFGLLNFNL